MADSPFFIVLWLACAAVTVVAAVLAGRSRRARYVGRAAVGILLPTMLLLLRAERRAATTPTPAGQAKETPPARVGV